MSDKILEFKSTADRPKVRVIPERLLEARKAVGITQAELARLVQVTRQSISYYELGTKQPEGNNLSRIAKELGQPVAFFVAENRQEPFGPLSARTYRAFGASTKMRRGQCDVYSEWASRISAYLDKYINFPAPNIPESGPSNEDWYTNEELESAANLVRSSWGLGVGPINNLTKLIESKGVFIICLPVSTGNVNAFSFWSGARPFIVLGSGEATTAVRRRYDLAHELGHLVLHQGVGEEELQDKVTLGMVEMEANRFAGAFLMPRKSFPNEVFSSRLESFIELKSRWKVSIAAQIYRCSDLKIFSERQVINLRKQLSAKKWRTKEPLDDELSCEVPSMLEDAASLAVKGGSLTPNRMFTDLNLSLEILEKATNFSRSELLGLQGEPSSPLELK